MYCTKCGALSREDSDFCWQCGALVAQSRSVRGTSRLAVASMILRVLGFPFGPCSIPAILCGALALGRIDEKPDLKGQGMAIVGLVCGIAAPILWIAAVLVIWWLVWTVVKSA